MEVGPVKQSLGFFFGRVKALVNRDSSVGIVCLNFAKTILIVKKDHICN